MADVFLSYSKKDKERIQSIIAFLEGNGYTVWWDRGIIPGTSWSSTIEDELNKAAAVVVVWSVDSVASEWVEIEAGKAKARKAYVPIMIDDVINNIPLEFSRIEVADFIDFDEHPENAETDLLFKAINRAKNPGDTKDASSDNKIVLKKRSFWSKWQTKITLIAAVIGIPLTIINIIAAFKSDKAGSGASEMNKPHFEFMYLSLEGTYEMADTAVMDPRIKLFLNYPQVSNEIISLRDSLSLSLFDSLQPKTTYLLIENKGKSAVSNIKLQVEKIFVHDTVLVRESNGKPADDYEANLKRKADRSYMDEFVLPVSLDAGAGILVPLFETIKPRVGLGDWIFTSRNICLPKKIIYKDAVTGEAIEIEIRKLVAPVVFRGGVEGRG